MSEKLDRMTGRFPYPGIVRWIGVRPARREPVEALDTVEVMFNGLSGDRRARPGKRAITLIQWEHLAVLAALTGRDRIGPDLLRRNIAVSGINLVALRKIEFRIGTVVLRGTGPCAPCSRMEDALGPGGFNAMRGHGGITAEVVEPGKIALGDAITAIAAG